MVTTIMRLVDADPELSRVVAERVEQSALQSMRTAGRLAWVPAEPFDQLKQALFEYAGEDAYVEFWRRSMRGIADNPLFHNLLEGGKRIFGKTPAGILKWMPRGFAVSTRGCGSFAVEFGDSRATVTLEGAPTSSRLRSTGQTTRATVLGMLDLMSIEGRVELDDSGMDDGRFKVHASWN